jgi:hypothetical protein
MATVCDKDGTTRRSHDGLDKSGLATMSQAAAQADSVRSPL